jgi:hypothetical protein
MLGAPQDLDTPSFGARCVVNRQEDSMRDEGLGCVAYPRRHDARGDRRGQRAGSADGESDVHAKIAEMTERDRSMAERLDAVIKASAPALSPRTCHEMSVYAKDCNVVCLFPSAQLGTRRTRGEGL